MADSMSWKQPYADAGIEMWLEPGECRGDRLLIATGHVAGCFTLPLHGADGNLIGSIDFEPYAVIRGRSVYRASAVHSVDGPSPSLPSAWSGALGLRREASSGDQEAGSSLPPEGLKR